MSAVAQEEKAADSAQAHASHPKDAAQSEDEQWQEVTDEAPFGPSPAAAAAGAEPSPSAAAAAAVAAESASVPPPIRRVKLYALNKSGVWEDKGTGHVSYSNIRTTRQRSLIDAQGAEVTDPTEEQFMIHVAAEVVAPTAAAAAAAGDATAASSTPATPAAAAAAAGPLLLSHELVNGHDYQMQGSTIITWCMAATGADVALSFQEGSCCEEAWALISEQLTFLHPHPAAMHLQQQHVREAEALAAAQAAAAAAAAQQHHPLMGGLDGDVPLDPRTGMSADGGSDTFGLDGVLSQHRDSGGSSIGGGGSDTDEYSAPYLPADQPGAPTVGMHSLDQLITRHLGRRGRISMRELQDVFALFRAKEAEFEDLLQEERAAWQAQKAEEAAAAANGTVGANAAAAAAVSDGVASPHTPDRAARSSAAEEEEDVPHSGGSVGSRDSSSLAYAAAASGGGVGAHAQGSPPSPELVPLLHTLSQLHSLFEMATTLLVLNDVNLLEFLLSENVTSLLGMLEYDPAWAEHCHPVKGGFAPANAATAAARPSADGSNIKPLEEGKWLPPRNYHTHRDFLRGARFHPVVPFHDAHVLAKVHQSYRAQYLKEVVLVAHLDDPVLGLRVGAFPPQPLQQGGANAAASALAAAAHGPQPRSLGEVLEGVLFLNTMVGIIGRLTDSPHFAAELFGMLNRFAGDDADAARAVEERERKSRFERQQTEVLMMPQSDDENAVSGGASASATPTVAEETEMRDTQPMQEGHTAPSSPRSASAAEAAVAAASSTAAAAAVPASSSSPSAGAGLSSTSVAAQQAQGSDGSAPSLRSVLLFLQELVLMAKGVQVSVRDSFYKMLDQHALFDVLEAILAAEELRARSSRRQRRSKQRAHAAGTASAAASPAAATAATAAEAKAAANEDDETDDEEDECDLATDAAHATAAASVANGPSAASASAASSSAATPPFTSAAAASTLPPPPHWLWLVCTDIISNICIHDASLFRTYLIATFHTGRSILSLVFRAIAAPGLSVSVAHQMSCLIRLVLDPEPMCPAEQELFLGRVYEQYLARLLRPLRFLQPRERDQNPFESHPVGTVSAASVPLDLRELGRQSVARQRREARASRFHIAAYHAIELLSYCALHHTLIGPSPSKAGQLQAQPQFESYFRSFAHRHNLLPFVMNILRSTRRNDLVCSAIRFFRICAGSSRTDEWATQLIVEHRLLEPIFIHFAANGPRYNLLNSVVCEMVHYFNQTAKARLEGAFGSGVGGGSILLLEHMHAEEHFSRFGLDRIVYVKTFQESRGILEEWRRIQGDLMMSSAAAAAAAAAGVGLDEPALAHARAPVSRTAHSILSDSDDDEEDSAAAAAAAAAASSAPAPASESAPSRKRKSDPHARLVSRRRARRTSVEGTGADADEMDGEEVVEVASAVAAAVAAVPMDESGSATEALLNYDDCASPSSSPSPSPSSSPRSSGSGSPSPEGEAGEQEGEDEAAAAASPFRGRIVFVSKDEGGVTRLPLPLPHAPADHGGAVGVAQRRVSLGKRKHESAESSESAEHLVPAASSPMAAPVRSPVLSSASASPPASAQRSPSGPVAHGSPHGSPHKHNPYLSVPQSELPPTAQRSPELQPQGLSLSLSLALSASPSADPAHAPPHPSSPPRELTVLDLAEESDAAADAEAEGRPYTPSSARSPSFGSSGLGVAMGPHAALSLALDAHSLHGGVGAVLSPPAVLKSHALLNSPSSTAMAAAAAASAAAGGTLLGALTASNKANSADQLQSPTKRRRTDA